MKSKIFIDTNILVYALDEHDAEKKGKCRFLLNLLVKDFQGVISTQVMQEFYVTAAKKLGADPLLVKDILHSFEQFEVIVVNTAIIYDAVDCSIINRISFWDSLITVAAANARCERLWTEDLNDGQVIRGVRVENPILHFDDLSS